MDKIRVIELFAGVGGFRIGFERECRRFKTIWSNQWEPSTKRQDASIIYCKRFGFDGHINQDIATIPTAQIPDADLLCAGFPCQDYSVARTLVNSKGIEGNKGVLWWQIYRILKEKANQAPKYLVLENVDRLLSSPAYQKGRDFAIILASLADLGYLVEWRVVNAADYGMPQRRKRLYIMAYSANSHIAQKWGSQQVYDWILANGILAKSMPCARADKQKRKSSTFTLKGNLSELTDSFNKTGGISPFANAGVMNGRNVWTLDVKPVYNGSFSTLGDILVDESQIPASYFITNQDLEKWIYLKGGKKYKRLTKDGYEYNYSEGSMVFPDLLDRASRTIITGEGGASPSRFKHVVQTAGGRYRRLLPIELERLNMFPDNHTEIEGISDTRRAFLMGNALVVGIVERIARVLEKEI